METGIITPREYYALFVSIEASAFLLCLERTLTIETANTLRWSAWGSIAMTYSNE